MKPFVCIIALLLSAILLLSSCKGGLTPDDMAFRLLNLYPDIPPCSQYIKNSEPYQPGYLSEEDFAYLYVGEKVKLPEWDMIDSFRLILSDSTEFFEIHIIRTVTTSDAEEIAKLLRRRAKLLTYHNKVEEDFQAEEPLVYISGKYAVLIATQDNASAERLLHKLLS